MTFDGRTGVGIISTGGETADLGDLVRTVVVDPSGHALSHSGIQTPTATPIVSLRQCCNINTSDPFH